MAANGFENRFGKVGTVATGGRGLDIIIHMEDETTTDANYSPLLWPLVNGQEGVVVTQAYLCRQEKVQVSLGLGINQDNLQLF